MSSALPSSSSTDTAPVPGRRGPRIVRGAAWVLAALALLAAAVQAFASWGFDPLLRRVLPAWLAERSGHSLQIAQARWEPWRNAIELRGVELARPDGAPLLAVQSLRVDLSLASVWQRAPVIESVELTGPTVHVARLAGGTTNWDALLAALAGPAAAPDTARDAGPPRMELQALALRGGRVQFDDAVAAGGFRAAVEAIRFDLQGLSTLGTPTAGRYTLAARSDLGASLDGSGQVALTPAVAASGTLQLQGLPLQRLWPYLSPLLTTEPVQGRADLSLAFDAAGAALRVDALKLQLSDLQLRPRGAPAPAIALGSLALEGGQLDLGARRVHVGRLSLQQGHVALARRGDGRLDALDWIAAPAASSAPASPAPTAPAPWHLQLDALDVQSVALRWQDEALAAPLQADVGALRLALRASATLGDPTPQLQVDGLAMTLERLQIASAGQRWAALDRLQLDDSQLVLHERQLTLGALALEGGNLALLRGADGRLPLLEALAARRPGAAAAPVPAAGAAQPAAPWTVRTGALRLAGFTTTLEDRSTAPAARLVLRGITAEAGPFGGDLAAPLPLTLRLNVASGGNLALKGALVPATGQGQIDVDLRDLAFAPAAPYLAQNTSLTLVGGRASTRGRLTLDGAGWRYGGQAAVQGLRLDEAGQPQPILAFERLSTLSLSASPQALRLGEVRLDGLAGRLTIFKDRSINLVRALKPAQAQDDGAVPAAPAPAVASTPAPASASTPAPASAAPPMAIAIERVRVSGAEIEFADLSLALPFAARIQELGGQVVGLSNNAQAQAAVELVGRVDPYGEARVAGTVAMFDPTRAMDLNVVFRNIEMTALTPYTATFAGRRIASGTLSLDLNYKLDRRQLLGENRVLMDKLVLGERVAVPSAADLPLDLAVALLSDADGRIDLGLPVSGSLDDPQFQLGPLVWKVFTNLLTKVVTAPFRALAALLGGGEESLDQIGFRAGEAVLAPPEREQLLRVAQALAQRPGLALTVEPAFDPATDPAALREAALRRDVARAAGQPLAEGAAPGPVVVSEPATQRALEQLHQQRFGAAALEAARRATGDTPLHERLRRALLDAQPLPDGAAQALAAARGEAVRAALGAQGVAPERLAVGPAGERAAEAGRVPTLLELHPLSAAPR